MRANLSKLMGTSVLQDEVKDGMWRVKPANEDGLVALYDFAPANVVNSESGQVI